jgi:hypothetical protein
MGSTLAHRSGVVRFVVDLDRGTEGAGMPLSVQVLMSGTPLPTVVHAQDVTMPRPGELLTFDVPIDVEDGRWLVLRITDPTGEPDDRAPEDFRAYGDALAYASPFYLDPDAVVDAPPAPAAPGPAAPPPSSGPSPSGGSAPGTASRALPATGAPVTVAGAAVAATGAAALAARLLRRLGRRAGGRLARAAQPAQPALALLVDVGRRADDERVGRADDAGVLVVVGEQVEHVAHGLEPTALLVVAAARRSTARAPCRSREHRLLGQRVVVPAVSDARSIGDSFHCRTGSTCRMTKRVRCSSRETENQNFTSVMPERTSARSSSGARARNSSYSSSLQKPMTRSTPARLYQDRSNIAISPAAAGAPGSAGSTTASARARWACPAPRRWPRAGSGAR